MIGMTIDATMIATAITTVDRDQIGTMILNAIVMIEITTTEIAKKASTEAVVTSNSIVRVTTIVARINLAVLTEIEPREVAPIATGRNLRAPRIAVLPLLR